MGQVTDDGCNGNNGFPCTYIDIPPQREAVIKPRRTGYKHKPILVVHGDIGRTEDGTVVRNLPAFCAAMDSHLWVTLDPSWLLEILDYYFTYEPRWTYQLADSETKTRATTRLTRFGLKPEEGRKRRTLHVCWAPMDMAPDPTSFIETSAEGMMKFAVDVRGWLSENNLPIPTALSGIGASLLRDSRFYPDPRGRVPHFINQRVREFLPGVHQETRARENVVHTAAALDQRGAYHQIVQDIDLPDTTTLHAYGYEKLIEGNPKPWLLPSDGLHFREALQRPGLIYARVLSRPTHRREFRPPAVNFHGVRDIYVWTNEVAFLEAHGVEFQCIYAAWISEEKDKGLARYGAWAQHRIQGASDYRKRWLKPALHSAYGLLGAKPRTLRIGRRTGYGEPATWYLGVRKFFVREIEIEHKPPLASCPTLGLIQAEVRLRTMQMANDLNTRGASVTHIHADGLHVVGDLPLLPDTWSITERTGLRYLDRVSWISDQGDVLPGRAGNDFYQRRYAALRPTRQRQRKTRTDYRTGIS